VFAQQSLQPKLSRRRSASVSYALQNNTVFSRAENWVSVSDGSWTDNGSEFLSVGPETAKHLFSSKIITNRLTHLVCFVLWELLWRTYDVSVYVVFRKELQSDTIIIILRASTAHLSGEINTWDSATVLT